MTDGRTSQWTAWVIALGYVLGAGPGLAQHLTEAIGIVTAAHGSVRIGHAGSANMAALSAQGPVLFNDVIETAEKSNAKALFQDDSMLSMGERTKVEIAEYIYDPDQHVRRMIVKLLHGTVRALVGRSFAGQGSMFEVRTGSISVVARSTYFIVWSDEQGAGVVNIGTTGLVGFTTGGRTVTIEPGHYALAETGKPPAVPVALNSQQLPAVHAAITGTNVRDDLSPSILQSVDQEIEDELKACPPGSPPGGICPRKPLASGVPPVTPPAVTSGAAGRSR